MMQGQQFVLVGSLVVAAATAVGCEGSATGKHGPVTALSAQAQQYTEVQATTRPIGDIEFDWGRDGISCPQCNFGQGNARFNWTDRFGDLWVGHLDSATGDLTPPEANNELADTNAFFWNVYGNGPE